MALHLSELVVIVFYLFHDQQRIGLGLAFQRGGTRLPGHTQVWGAGSGAEEGGEVGRLPATSPRHHPLWADLTFFCWGEESEGICQEVAVITKCHSVGGLNIRNAFLTVLESEIRLPAWSGSGKCPFPGVNKKNNVAHYPVIQMVKSQPTAVTQDSVP